MRRIMLLVAVLLVAGCASEKAQVTPARAWFKQSVDEKFVFGPNGELMRNADGTPMTAKVVVVEAEGAGVGAVGEGVKSIKAGDPPTAGPVGSSGGKGSLKWFDLDAVAANPTILIIMGGVLIVGGAVLGYFLGWTLGAMVAAAGACLLAVAWYPWLLLVVAGLALLAFGYLAWGYAKGQTASETLTKTQETLSTVVNAVEEAGKAAKDAVTDKVKSRLASAAEVSSIIESVKE